jgi:hypothetical protein
VATDKNRQTRYYQIAQSVRDETLLHKEMTRSHKLVGSKYLLTLDPEEQNSGGIPVLARDAPGRKEAAT